jgi:hypothetical protein
MHDYGSAIKVIHSGKYTDMYDRLLEWFPLSVALFFSLFMTPHILLINSKAITAL